jgi:predicted metallopeptidase
MIKYEEADDIRAKIEHICSVLEMNHVRKDRVFCIRSHGSSSRNIIARCHALPKIMQMCLKTEPSYIIEVVSEAFDRQSDEEKTKTLIHELLHIPKAFGGGFLHHNVVTRAKIDRLYQKFKNSIAIA